MKELQKIAMSPELRRRMEISLACLMIGGALVESEGEFFNHNTGRNLLSSASISNAVYYCKSMRERIMKNYPDFAESNYDRANDFAQVLKRISYYQTKDLKDLLTLIEMFENERSLK